MTPSSVRFAAASAAPSQTDCTSCCSRKACEAAIAPKTISAATVQQTRTNGSVEPRSPACLVLMHAGQRRRPDAVHRLWTAPVDTVDTRSGGAARTAEPVDDGPARRRPRTLPGMDIEIRALEVHALAAVLRDAAGEADWIGVRLAGSPQVGGPLQPAVDAFLDCHRTAGQALAGELGGWAPRWPPPPTRGCSSTARWLAPAGGCARHERRRPGAGPARHATGGSCGARGLRRGRRGDRLPARRASPPACRPRPHRRRTGVGRMPPRRRARWPWWPASPTTSPARSPLPPDGCGRTTTDVLLTRRRVATLRTQQEEDFAGGPRTAPARSPTS